MRTTDLLLDTDVCHSKLQCDTIIVFHLGFPLLSACRNPPGFILYRRQKARQYYHPPFIKKGIQSTTATFAEDWQAFSECKHLTIKSLIFRGYFQHYSSYKQVNYRRFPYVVHS